ncbi:MAG: response regulator, partial [Cyclobacteriaceae bacterium]|nr:response regulator [Cyclobacteriaceae bacterium]
MKKLLGSLSTKIDHFLADPRLSQVEIIRKRVAFDWTLGSTFSVFLLTIFAFFMGVRILGIFGLVLLVYYAIIIPFFRKHNFDFYQAFFLAATILTAFVFILIFGGYMNSAGLIFVGLNCVISSLLMKSQRTAFFLFFLYIFTIIALAILDPYLHNHPDITPKINFLFFIINTIWMSAIQMFFVITYLKERNKYQLAETNRLKELDNVKTGLFTSISHEFRTPITLITGMADQIPHKDVLTINSIKIIKKHSSKLLNLVNQILDLAKIDSKAIKTHFIQTDIIDFLKYSLESYHSSAFSKEIQLTFNSNVEELNMDFDREKMEGIISNLVSNAIKYTPSAGKISLNVNYRANKKLDQIRSGEFLEIIIEDSGIGISAEKQLKIFDKYYQVNDESDIKYEGYGIGLTIVKEYVKLLNGEIFVQSEIGKGSQFKVVLPVTRNFELALSVKDDKIETPDIVPDNIEIIETENQTIVLIVEDNEDVMNYLYTLLSDKYHIIKANNGKTGLEKALEYVPDIILSDVMMPEMDGIEFLKKVKEDIRTSHIPFVILTAKADIQSRLEGLEYGAEAYLVKPFNKQELFIRLKKLLDLRKILQKRYQSNELEKEQESYFTKFEDQFIRKVQEAIDAHLDDELFTIKELCRELAM